MKYQHYQMTLVTSKKKMINNICQKLRLSPSFREEQLEDMLDSLKEKFYNLHKNDALRLSILTAVSKCVL